MDARQVLSLISPFNRRLLAYLHDIVMAGLAFLLAVYMRGGEELFRRWSEYAIGWQMALFMAAAAVSVLMFRMHKGIWRYASMGDAAAILRAATLTVLLSTVFAFFAFRAEGLPRTVPLFAWFVLIVFLGAPRVAYRLLKDSRTASAAGRAEGGRRRTPVLLLGAGDTAEMFIRYTHGFGSGHEFDVVGMLDEKGSRVGRLIQGVPVLGQPQQLAAVVQQLQQRGRRPQQLILTKVRERLDGEMLRELVREAEALDLTLARLPSLTEFEHDVLDPHPRLKSIAVEDLLGRPQAALNRGAIGELICGRTVLVSGAGGSIGSELVRQIAAEAPLRLVLVENSEFALYKIDMEIRGAFPELQVLPVVADVRDRPRVMRLFERFRPELVFHAAALKHVPMVEANSAEGVLTNVFGTANVADAAIAVNARAMVLISSDKAVNPTNVMGATKRIAECYCQALDLAASAAESAGERTRFMTVRFGNVLGSNGSVVPLFERQLQAGGPLTVTHPDIKRYFMTIREAVELVLQASAHGMTVGATERGKIFVLDMGEPIRIVDLARQMIRLAGLRPDEDVKIEFTGLRPGEKLFEELFDVAEPPQPTAAAGVLSAAPRAVDATILQRALRELRAAADSDDELRLRAMIRHIVPEFSDTPVPDRAQLSQG